MSLPGDMRIIHGAEYLEKLPDCSSNYGPKFMMNDESSKPGLIPPPSLGCDCFVAVYSIWTILTNLTALLKGGLNVLLLISSIVCCISMVLGIWMVFIRNRYSSSSVNLFSSIPHEIRPTFRFSQKRVIFYLILIIVVVLTLVAHRPDADDAHFINWAINAIEYPDAPLLHFDQKVSIPGALETLALRKVHSFEVLAGVIAFVTKCEPIYIFHLVFPALGAILVCFGQRELIRLLEPNYWLIVFSIAILFLCLNGEIHRTYGNFGFVRLHQGKAIMLSAIAPLIAAAGFRFGHHPSWVNWLRLAGTQICAMGFTVNAVWLGPLISFLSIGAALNNDKWGVRLKYWGLGQTASIYVLGLAVFYKLSYSMPSFVYSTPLSSMELFQYHFRLVFTQHPISVFQVAVACTAWIFVPSSLVRKYFLYSICAVVLIGNPVTAKFIAGNVTGVETYWRIFWILPMPAMVGMVMIRPLTIVNRFHLRWANSFVFGLSLSGLIALGWNHSVFRPSNHTVMKPPGLKVTEEFKLAQALRGHLIGRPDITAPDKITIWVTTLLSHPYPLLAQSRYARLYGEEGQRRLIIKQYINGSKRPLEALSVLKDAFNRYRMGAVCLLKTNPWVGEINSFLDHKGFIETELDPSYKVWINPIFGKNLNRNAR